MYRETTEKRYFCARCGKEIKSIRGKTIKFEQMIAYPSGEVQENFLASRDRGLYFCPKCLKDFNAFIRNEYPTKQSDKEKMLADKLEEITEMFTDDIHLLHEHISAINDYANAIDFHINGSPFKETQDDDLEYLSIKLKIMKFLKDIGKIKEESEGKDNE